MKMKIFPHTWGFLACFLLVFHMSSAQDKDEKTITVQKHTIMDQFAPELIPTASERLELKKDRIAYQRNTKMILDTLDISHRKRRRLLKELKRNPFSEYLNKIIMAETHFEDTAIKTDSNQ